MIRADRLHRKEYERNTVLSIIESGGWLEFEKNNTPYQMEELRQITKRKFVKQIRQVKPFFEQAIKK